jgi:hypothetical protein
MQRKHRTILVGALLILAAGVGVWRVLAGGRGKTPEVRSLRVEVVRTPLLDDPRTLSGGGGSPLGSGGMELPVETPEQRAQRLKREREQREQEQLLARERAEEARLLAGVLALLKKRGISAVSEIDFSLRSPPQGAPVSETDDIPLLHISRSTARVGGDTLVLIRLELRQRLYEKKDGPLPVSAVTWSATRFGIKANQEWERWSRAEVVRVMNSAEGYAGQYINRTPYGLATPQTGSRLRQIERARQGSGQSIR